MAATNTFRTRLQLKYDTYTNWTTLNPQLLAGEVAIATIATGNTQEVNSVAAPQVLIKVGDGTNHYNALPFVSAKAADVYGWAKKEHLEFSDLSEAFKNDLNEHIGIQIQDTDTQYTIVKVSDYQYELQSKTKDGVFTSTGVYIDIPDDRYDDTAVQDELDRLAGLIGENSVAAQIAAAVNGLATVEAVNTAEQNAKDYAENLNATMDSRVKTLEAIKHDEFAKTADIQDALDKAATAVQPATLNNYYTKEAADAAFMDADETGDAIDAKISALKLSETYEPIGAETRANAYADSLASDYATAAQGAKADSALQKADITTGTTNGTIAVKGTDVKVYGLGDAAYENVATINSAVIGSSTDSAETATIWGAKAAAAKVQENVDTVNDKIGAVPTDKTVVQMIADAQTAATYDDTAVRGLIADNTEAIEGVSVKVTTLIGEDSGKSARTIAAEETAKIVAGADTAYDTLKEIADWISTHGSDAATMNSNITALQNQLKGIDVGEGTVKQYIADALDAYTTTDDFDKLAARVGTNETNIGTLTTTVNSLHKIATSGNITDLEQGETDWVVFNCGSASTVI